MDIELKKQIEDKQQKVNKCNPKTRIIYLKGKRPPSPTKRHTRGGKRIMKLY